MSDGLLTLKDIFDLNLAESGGLRLAILSACETGIHWLENADEAVSLPTGLLQAGVAAVIASLWSVSDLSTMLLLTRFYDFWRKDGLAMDQALRQAQQWVRDTTNGEKIAYFKDFMPTQSTTKMPASAADYLYKSLILSRPDERDFAHPFHWAAFSYTGV
jgi:CHAT domain-containing protein